MIIEEALTAYLTIYPPLALLQGARLYPNTLPQDATMPATVYQRVSTGTDYSHDGPLELQHARFQFSCWATDPLTAMSVVSALGAALSGYRGMMGDVKIEESFLENRFGNHEPDTGLHREVIDVTFGYKE